MVQRKVLEKLSDSELEKYVEVESRFVPEAIQYAFDILKERGKIFSENETEQIQSLIKSKFENEPKFEQIKNNGWDRNFTENENAIELYTNRLIWIFSVLFGVIFGTALQAYNFFKLKRNKAAIVTIIFGFVYSTFQIYLMNYIGDIQYGRFSLRFLLSGIGALGLYIIRENIFKTSIEYRAKSFVLPLVICILIHIPILYAIITTH
ncbi:hypothetical protein HER18_05135 [Chryseobacterium sp. NEB161]|nr:hypothetical protein HER18_05135 [Chryseobacterium sp. NEB161]